MTSLSNQTHSFRRRPGHTSRHFMYTAHCVKNDTRLPKKNSRVMKLRQFFQVPIKTRPFQLANLVINLFNKRPEVLYHPPPLISLEFLRSHIFKKSTCGGHFKFQ